MSSAKSVDKLLVLQTSRKVSSPQRKRVRDPILQPRHAPNTRDPFDPLVLFDLIGHCVIGSFIRHSDFDIRHFHNRRLTILVPFDPWYSLNSSISLKSTQLSPINSLADRRPRTGAQINPTAPRDRQPFRPSQLKPQSIPQCQFKTARSTRFPQIQVNNNPLQHRRSFHPTTRHQRHQNDTPSARSV